jgi:hypothetical protein
MGKEILKISILGLIEILLCIMVFHVSCEDKYSICTGCFLTKDEISFIPYSSGNSISFKNDSSGINGTLHVISKDSYNAQCSSPCDEKTGTILATFSFDNWENFYLDVERHGMPPYVYFSHNGNGWIGYELTLNGTTHNVIINGTTYNDIYTVQMDSINIDTLGDSQIVPWKIDYSKSKGFVRFHMVNGQTWSKLSL